MLSDVRYAVRCLRKSPLFSIVVSLTLALGIGATTAIFSLVDAVLLKTLPVQDPKALVTLKNVTAKGQDVLFSYPMFEAVSERQVACSGLFAWTSRDVNVGPREGAEFLPAQFVSGQYFSTLGLSAHLGRTITEEDVEPTARNVVVISYRFWQSHFGGDPDVFARTLIVEEIPMRIVGIAPEDFRGLNIGTPPKLFLPLTTDIPGNISRETRNLLWLNLIGRLNAEVTMAQAQAQLDSIWLKVLEDTVPLEHTGERRARFLSQVIRLDSASRGVSYMRSDFAKVLLFLMAVAGLFFLLACCNIAGLLLARGMAREKEMAIRRDLGASRWRLIRQLLIESFLLSIPGGVSGLVLGHVGARFFLSIISQRLVYFTLDLAIDYRILLFVFVLSLLNGIAFGLLPAWRTTQINPNAIGNHRRSWRPSRVLVSVQIGLSLVLLIMAGLLLRSFANFSSVNLGFAREGLLHVGLKRKGDLFDTTGMAEYYQQLLHRTNAVPGVRSASLIHLLPLYPYHRTESFSIRGGEQRPEEETSAYINHVSPDLFQTLGVPFKSGRDFGFLDGATTRKVGVINESMAKAFFPSGEAVGSVVGLHPDPEENQVEVVGVVADSVYRDPRDRGSYAIYLSCFQEPRRLNSLGLLVRSVGDPRNVEGAVADVVETLGRQQPVYARTFKEWIGWVIWEETLAAIISSFFSFSALVLASMGLYALMAYTVARRTYEIGVRIALGARRADVQWLILRDALLLTTIGAILGVVSVTCPPNSTPEPVIGWAWREREGAWKWESEDTRRSRSSGSCVKLRWSWPRVKRLGKSVASWRSPSRHTTDGARSMVGFGWIRPGGSRNSRPRTVG